MLHWSEILTDETICQRMTNCTPFTLCIVARLVGLCTQPSLAK